MAEGGPSRKLSAAEGASLTIEVLRREPGFARAKVSDALLRRAARAALRAARRSGPSFRVTLLLTDDAEMRALNLAWRGKDAPTNVLSFPADTKHDRGFLGDIALAYDTALTEAKARDIPLADHAAHLVVHGMLHLLGFDHEDEAGAERMEAIERIALASIGIGDPYAETDAPLTAEVSP